MRVAAYKNLGPALVRRDEAECFGAAEPFDGSGVHDLLRFVVLGADGYGGLMLCGGDREAEGAGARR